MKEELLSTKTLLNNKDDDSLTLTTIMNEKQAMVQQLKSLQLKHDILLDSKTQLHHELLINNTCLKSISHNLQSEQQKQIEIANQLCEVQNVLLSKTEELNSVKETANQWKVAYETSVEARDQAVNELQTLLSKPVEVVSTAPVSESTIPKEIVQRFIHILEIDTIEM